MGVALAVAAMACGFVVAVLASRVAVAGATDLVARSPLPPFVVGLTLVAVGTDLPEMANSVTASLEGLGDVNVGDSIGSVVTQVTLVLGLLPLVGGALVLAVRQTVAAGAVILLALGLGAVLMRDGELARVDGLLLVLAWLGGSALVWWAGGVAPPRPLADPSPGEPPAGDPSPGEHTSDGAGRGEGLRGSLSRLAAGLAGVTLGAVTAIWGVVHLADAAGLPLFVVSFFGAALGTSLPELLFSVTALRRGEAEMAVGDALGASMVDATLSIGIGPLVAPTLVSTGLVERGVLVSAVAVVLVVALLAWRRRHTVGTGLALVGLYLGVYAVLLA
ncbi:sodium:calcium antiporter [Phycicoccus endophyticus]|uniref:Sodium:calcium antiporter n=1 Tax=Phycicoccus endophyticus TaxID=1690220 RepID=A0A7G9QZ25_9MICO|nr:sodium:calcium antiporter [Phycicoccus endophyticus]NHI18941.1 sodium:calcium antiporter [Phycicoccus endophyticus]QNN48600.1 sodium:calcium antiporter [Phycicoccus endophyticus]GGL31562.1 sodium:calcium antiporter [Phycicoccus endophyticus]